MFYGWDMTSNVSTGKVAIQSTAMKIGFNQFLDTRSFPHSILAPAFYLYGKGSISQRTNKKCQSQKNNQDEIDLSRFTVAAADSSHSSWGWPGKGN